MTPVVRLAWLPGADRMLGLPRYQTGGAAGADLIANLDPADRDGGLTLAPGERRVIPTGLRVAIPDGYEGQVRARSGLARRLGLVVPNAPGTIDSDYRGELGVLLMNAGREPAPIRHGDRIAQLVVAPVARATFALADALDDTPRGAAGFGSTGVSQGDRA